MLKRLFYYLCDHFDHYEVNTLKDDGGEVESSACFLTKNTARKFYNLLQDDFKEFLLVDKNGYIIHVIDINY